MRYVLTVALLLAGSAAYAWTHNNHPDTPEEAKLTHAFACGYAYAKHRDHRECPEFADLEKRHGFD